MTQTPPTFPTKKSHHKPRRSAGPAPLPPTAPESTAPPPPDPTPHKAAAVIPPTEAAEPLPMAETLTEEEQKTLIEAGVPLTPSPIPAAAIPLSSTEQALLRRMKAAVSEPAPTKMPRPAMPEKIVSMPLPPWAQGPRGTPPQERVLPPSGQDPRTVPSVSTAPTRLRYLESPASLPRQVRLQALLAAMSTSGLRYLTTWPREAQQLIYTLNDRLIIDRFADLVPAVNALCLGANMDLRSPAAAGTIAKIAAGILAIWAWNEYIKIAVTVDRAAAAPIAAPIGAGAGAAGQTTKFLQE